MPGYDIKTTNCVPCTFIFYTKIGLQWSKTSPIKLKNQLKMPCHWIKTLHFGLVWLWGIAILNTFLVARILVCDGMQSKLMMRLISEGKYLICLCQVRRKKLTSPRIGGRRPNALWHTCSPKNMLNPSHNNGQIGEIESVYKNRPNLLER